MTAVDGTTVTGHWAQQSLPLPMIVYQMTYTANTMYAGTGNAGVYVAPWIQLFGSNDAGTTWKTLTPSIAANPLSYSQVIPAVISVNATVPYSTLRVVFGASASPYYRVTAYGITFIAASAPPTMPPPRPPLPPPPSISPPPPPPASPALPARSVGINNVTVVYGVGAVTSTTTCAVSRAAGVWVDVVVAIDASGLVETYVDGNATACSVSCALGPASLCYPANNAGAGPGFTAASRVDWPVLLANADTASFRLDQPRLGVSAVYELAAQLPLNNGDCPAFSTPPVADPSTAVPVAAAWASSVSVSSAAALAGNTSGMSPSYFFSTGADGAPYVAYDLGSAFYVTGVQVLPRADGCASCMQWFANTIRSGASSSVWTNPVFAPGPARYVSVHGASSMLQLRAFVVSGASLSSVTLPSAFSLTDPKTGKCLTANATLGACGEVFSFFGGSIVALTSGATLPMTWTAFANGTLPAFSAGGTLLGGVPGWNVSAATPAAVPMPQSLVSWRVAGALQNGVWPDMASGTLAPVSGLGNTVATIEASAPVTIAAGNGTEALLSLPPTFTMCTVSRGAGALAGAAGVVQSNVTVSGVGATACPAGCVGAPGVQLPPSCATSSAQVYLASVCPQTPCTLTVSNQNAIAGFGCTNTTLVGACVCPVSKTAWTHGPLAASYANVTFRQSYAPLGLNVLCASSSGCASLNGAGGCGVSVAATMNPTVQLNGPWNIAEVLVWNTSLTLAQQNAVATSYAVPKYSLLAAPQTPGTFALVTSSGCLAPASPPTSAASNALAVATWACADPAGAFSWNGSALVHAASGMCVAANATLGVCELGAGNWTWTAGGTISSPSGCAAASAPAQAMSASPAVYVPNTPTVDVLATNYTWVSSTGPSGIGPGNYSTPPNTYCTPSYASHFSAVCCGAVGSTEYMQFSALPNMALKSYTMTTSACQTLLQGTYGDGVWYSVDDRTNTTCDKTNCVPNQGTYVVNRAAAAYVMYRLTVVVGPGVGWYQGNQFSAPPITVSQLSATFGPLIIPALSVSPPQPPPLPAPPTPPRPPQPPPGQPAGSISATNLFVANPAQSFVTSGTTVYSQSGVQSWTVGTTGRVTIVAAGAGDAGGGAGSVVATTVYVWSGQVITMYVGRRGAASGAGGSTNVTRGSSLLVAGGTANGTCYDSTAANGAANRVSWYSGSTQNTGDGYVAVIVGPAVSMIPTSPMPPNPPPAPPSPPPPPPPLSTPALVTFNTPGTYTWTSTVSGLVSFVAGGAGATGGRGVVVGTSALLTMGQNVTVLVGQRGSSGCGGGGTFISSAKAPLLVAGGGGTGANAVTATSTAAGYNTSSSSNVNAYSYQAIDMRKHHTPHTRHTCPSSAPRCIMGWCTNNSGSVGPAPHAMSTPTQIRAVAPASALATIAPNGAAGLTRASLAHVAPGPGS